MFNSQVEAALTVIALSIFADKRVLSTEISTFVGSADILQAKLRSDIPITEAKLLMWFEINRETIRSKMRLNASAFKQWLDELLGELSLLRDNSFILERIESIARADGEYHISEEALAVVIERNFSARV